MENRSLAQVGGSFLYCPLCKTLAKANVNLKIESVTVECGQHGDSSFVDNVWTMQNSPRARRARACDHGHPRTAGDPRERAGAP
eukprot:6136992-Pyramimonas_sp.AAC.1